MSRFSRQGLLRNVQLCLICVFSLLPLAVPAEEAGTVLVTGANRGIGLEFVRQYTELGYRVIATARNPQEAPDLLALQKQHPTIVVEKLDVTDLAAIDGLATRYKNQPIDILINNAGTTGDPYKTQNFGKIDYAGYDTVMHVNVVGPLKITEAFLDNVAASRQKKVIAISSSMGSITQSFGLGYFYRSSKAALNMALHTLAKDPTAGAKKKGIIVGLLDPGPTDTDMMAELRGRMKLRDVKTAVSDMIRNIDNLTAENSGSFIEYDGKPIPW